SGDARGCGPLPRHQQERDDCQPRAQGILARIPGRHRQNPARSRGQSGGRQMRFLFLIALLASSSAFSQTIKIGELNSYKVFPAFLEPYKKGMELAIEEINGAGGVLGKKLELVMRDDGGNPGDAVRVAEELISREKVNLLMGTFASNVGLAVSNLAAQR